MPVHEPTHALPPHGPELMPRLAAPLDSSEFTLSPCLPLCAAPEQLMGQRCTLASDLYSFGVLLIELTTFDLGARRGDWRLPLAPEECPQVGLRGGCQSQPISPSQYRSSISCCHTIGQERHCHQHTLLCLLACALRRRLWSWCRSACQQTPCSAQPPPRRCAGCATPDMPARVTHLPWGALLVANTVVANTVYLLVNVLNTCICCTCFSESICTSQLMHLTQGTAMQETLAHYVDMQTPGPSLQAPRQA